MQEVRDEQFLWVEKYRPTKLDDCILPVEQLAVFKEFVEKGEIQNMLLCGGAGMGKTTVARAICEELGTDYIIINGSEESGIDVLRTKIKQFASTVSFSGKTKVIILDEADYLNCLQETEEILLADGSHISLKDMKDNTEYNIISFNAETLRFEEDTAWIINRAQKQIYEVELDSGEVIRVTEDHPFMVKDTDGNILQRTINEGLEGYEIILK